ncbi:MAG TPA: hypothetical protein PLU72_16290 [Candidatus Ozemobacteraceae bacterium]|nr:hypothetical protein [Candidatus Ozemobacteraceae bacterium]
MRRLRIGIAGAVLALALLAAPLSAWGPMTHLAVNTCAWSQAALDARLLRAVPESMKDLFIGGGPAPDIKFNAGDGFPREFHFDPETILRMVDLAKNDPRYGLADVAMALGWAGHLFAEVPSAHTSEGYPSTKLTVPLSNAGYINHQLCELCTDILVYRDMREALRKASVSFPVRLLEASMKAEHERDSKIATMSAERLKTAGNAFLPTAVGVRTIADYLLEERPELLDEMDAFYGERREHFDRSVSDVAAMLREHGLLKTAKASSESADRTYRVRVPLEGTLKDKTKTFVYNALYKSLRTGAANDIFTFVACHAIDGIVSNGLKDKLTEVAGKAVGGSIAGDKRHQQIVIRFVSGLLARHDLTFPEIIAYAIEGIETDPAFVAKRQKQFAALGLAADGRRRYGAADVSAAIAEVKRIEDVRREWPWFWPFRPSLEKLAEARSRASRLMACMILDDVAAAPVLKSRAEALLKADRALRAAMWNSRSTSWFNPVKKWNARQEFEKAEAALAPQELFFAQLIAVQQEIGTGADRAAKLEKLWNQADIRRREIATCLANARAALAKLPITRLADREKVKDEIRNLENDARAADEYVAALEMLRKTGSAPASDTASDTAAVSSVALSVSVTPSVTMPEKYAGRTDLELRRLREAAYKTYTALTLSRATDDPEVTAALRELREIDQARRALEAMQGAK